MGLPAAPVAHDGHDLQLDHGNALGLLNKVRIAVELVVPVLLFLHCSPCAGRLVIGHGDAVFRDFLQVDCTADAHAVQLDVDALFNDVGITLAVLKNVVDGGAKDGPHHVGCVLSQVFPMLALELDNPWAVEQLGYRHVGLAFAVLRACDHVEDRFGHAKVICQFHLRAPLPWSVCEPT